MSVLKKKIELQSQEVAPPSKLSTPWETLFEGLLPTFEILMSQVKWTTASHEIGIYDVAQLEKEYSKKALYFSFAPKVNEHSCVVVLESKLAGMVRRCSFAETIDDFANIAVKDPSKLDVLLPVALIDQIVSAVKLNGKGRANSEEWDAGFVEEASTTEFSSLELSEHKGGWVKMSSHIQGDLGRKVKPESFRVDIIMPYGIIQNSLSDITQAIDLPEPVLDLEECHSELKRHLSHTIMPVRAVLENIELSIADCTRMRLGQVIPLPGVSVSSLRLEAGIDDERSCIASAELGIIKSNRAVRLSQDVETSFIDNFVATD